jgi:hypothetical protein
MEHDPARKTSERPVPSSSNVVGRDSGHGGGATLTALIEQDVDELSFYCWALDVAPPSPGDASAPARR